MTHERRTRISPSSVLFPLGLGTALSLIGDATLYTVLPTHTADAGIALGSVGILFGANRAVRLFLNGPAGMAYDRLPRRRLLVPGLFIGAVSTAVYAATHGFWPLLAGRLLWGVAWSAIWVGGATVILDVTTSQDRGRWTGLYQTWFFLGAALGALAGGLLTDAVGYSATMWVASAVTALGGVAAWLWLPETRGSREQSQCPISREGRPRLRANRGLWVAATVQGTSGLIASGVLPATLGLLAQDWLRSSPLAIGTATLTGVLMAGRTALSTVAAPLAGTASDRLGSRWKVASWGLAAGVVSMILLALSTPVAVLAGVAGVAVARGTTQTIVTALIGDLVSQEQRGRALGLVHTASDLGSAIGPPAAYALLPWIGLGGVYLACAVLFVVELGLVLSYQLRSPRTRR